jgi:hypothetical protein
LAEKRYLEFPVVSRSRKQVQDDLFKQVIAGKGPPDETDGEEPIIAADPLAQSRLRAQGLPSTDRPAAGSIAERFAMEAGFGEAGHEPLTDLWRLSTQALPELAAQSIPYNLGDILDREALVKSGLIYPPGGPSQFDPKPDLLPLLKGEASVTETKEALLESFHERSPAGQMAVVGQYDLSNLLPIPVGRAKFGQKALAESVAKLGRGKPVFVPGARGAVAPSGVPRFGTPLALPPGTGRTAEGAIISPGQMPTFPTPKVPVAPVEHSLVIVTPQKPLGEKLIFANKRNLEDAADELGMFSDVEVLPGNATSQQVRVAAESIQQMPVSGVQTTAPVTRGGPRIVEPRPTQRQFPRGVDPKDLDAMRRKFQSLKHTIRTITPDPTASLRSIYGRRGRKPDSPTNKRIRNLQAQADALRKSIDEISLPDVPAELDIPGVIRREPVQRIFPSTQRALPPDVSAMRAQLGQPPIVPPERPRGPFTTKMEVARPEGAPIEARTPEQAKRLRFAIRQEAGAQQRARMQELMDASGAGGNVPPGGRPAGAATPGPGGQPFSTGSTYSDEVLSHVSMGEGGSVFDAELWRRRIDGGYGWFKTNVVDDLQAVEQFVRRAEAELGLKRGDLPMQWDAYRAGRNVRGGQGKAEVAFEFGTFTGDWYKTEGGKLVPNLIGPSLRAVLEPISNPEQFTRFISYLISKRAVELTGRNIPHSIPIETAMGDIATANAQFPHFAGVADGVYQFQNDILNYGKEMGLLTPELVQKILSDNAFYVPFNKVIDATATKGWWQKRLASVRPPVRPIRGETQLQIVNPLESIIKNTYLMISAADRNQVGLMMADLVERAPQLQDVFQRVKNPVSKVATVRVKEVVSSVDGITKEELDQVIDILGLEDTEATFNIFRPSKHSKDGVISVLRDGKKEFYKVSPDLEEALIHLDRSTFNPLLKMLSMPARTMRAGAILSPEFMFRNVIRDQFHAWVFSRYGYVPLVDFGKGMADVLQKKKEYILYKMSGAEYATMVSVDRDYLRQGVKEITRQQNLVDHMHPLRALQAISDVAEKSTRMGEFSRALRAGVTPPEAAFSARDLMDYQKMGTVARSLNQIIPFFNASIRGTDKMITSFRDNPVRTSFKTLAGITLPSMALYYVNRDNPKYQSLPQWQKDLFWIIILPESMGGEIIRIPKPHEVGVLYGSVPERFLEWLDGTSYTSMTETLGTIFDIASPGIIPQSALPWIENATNHSFFRGVDLVPEYLQKYNDEQQFTYHTSEVAKKLGAWGNWSPIKVDNVMYAYSAGLGQWFLDAIDELLIGTGIVQKPARPTREKADIPVVKAFVTRDPTGLSSNEVNRFYDEKEKVEKHEAYMKLLESQGKFKQLDKYSNDHPEVYFTREPVTDPRGIGKPKVWFSKQARLFREHARRLSEVRTDQRIIWDHPTMDGKEKRRRLDVSNEKISRYTKSFLNDYVIGKELRELPAPPDGRNDYKPGRVIPTEKMEKPATDTELPFPDYEPISAPAQPSLGKIKFNVSPR